MMLGGALVALGSIPVIVAGNAKVVLGPARVALSLSF
jgi:hypothetical protein